MLILLLILATCAVKFSYTKNSYYLIEMPNDIEDHVLAQIKKPFTVYWNVPTQQCTSNKIPFENLYEKFGITQNTNDTFVGDKISILYLDPHLFPMISDEVVRNGGVPQLGDLSSHLHEFASTVDKFIPDTNFNGVGVLDFEKWRPIFRQNFPSGVLAVYQNRSIDIEWETHWWWSNTRIQEEARMRFEESARRFMQTTLSLAKEMRPKALWGYYGYPLCFNQITEECSSELVLEENDQISWLWAETTAVFPSVYSYSVLPPSQLAARVRGRVREALRVSRNDTPVLPYFSFVYRGNQFFSEDDLNTVLKTLYNSNASGFVIWGASENVNTVEKCKKLYEYVEQVLGPAVAKYTKYRTVRVIDSSMIACMKKVNALENVTISVSAPEKYCGSDTMIINTNITMNNPFNEGAPNILNINIDSHIAFHAGTVNNYFLNNSTAKQDLDFGNGASSESNTKERELDITDAGILNYTTNYNIGSSTTEENYGFADVTGAETIDGAIISDIESSTREENYGFTDVTGSETKESTIISDIESSTREENYGFTDVIGSETMESTIISDIESSTREENYGFTDIIGSETMESTIISDIESSTREENYGFTDFTGSETMESTIISNIESSTKEENYGFTDVSGSETMESTIISDIESSTREEKYGFTDVTGSETMESTIISDIESSTREENYGFTDVSGSETMESTIISDIESSTREEKYGFTDVTGSETMESTIISDIESSTREENYGFTDVSGSETMESTIISDIESSTREEKYGFTDVTGSETMESTIISDIESSTREENYGFTDVSGSETMESTIISDIESSTREENYGFTDVTGAETSSYTTNYDLYTESSNDYYGYDTASTAEINFEDENKKIIESDPEVHYLFHEESTRDIQKTKYDIDDRLKVGTNTRSKYVFSGLDNNVSKRNNISLNDIVMGTKRDKNLT